MKMKLDVLAFGAHPDDVELGCSGTLLKLKSEGKKIGVVDLTRGELGTRGSAELRDQEAAAAAMVLGLDVRVNLGFSDGFFFNDREHQLKIISVIRDYCPEVIFINAPFDRHPDHGRGCEVVRDAAFLAGLRKVETGQEAWRPKKVYSYIQDHRLEPSFVVDISGHFEGKMASIEAYRSQFYDPQSDEPATYISSQNFIKNVEARARQMGHLVGVTYGEGFIAERPLRIDDLMTIL